MDSQNESKDIETNSPSTLADKIILLLNNGEDIGKTILSETEKKLLPEALNLIEPYPVKIAFDNNQKKVLKAYRSESSPTYKKSSVIPQKKFSLKKLLDEFYNWATGKFTLLTVGLLILILSLKEKILYPIIDSLINHIFLKIKGVNFNILCVLALILITLYWIKKIWDKARISKWFNFLNIALAGIYTYFRFFDDTYSFFPIDSFLPYLDIVLLHLLGLIIANFAQYKTQLYASRKFIIDKLRLAKRKGVKTICHSIYKVFKKNNPQFWITINKVISKTTPLFLEDTPIENTKDDKYNRSRFAKELAERIKETNTKNSYAISIQDAWGNGKTSFMKLLENECKAYPDTITLWFNPWLAENKKLLIVDFFNVLHQKTGVYDAKLGKEILLYSQKLNAIAKSNYTAILESALTLGNTSTLYEHYDQINKRIAQLGKKIIIFIDDLDRLDNEEIIETLRIIRNTSNFNNTFFVVANDKAIVDNALIESKVHNAEKYTEKIFQMVFPLPIIKTDILIDELKTRLIENFKDDKDEIQNTFEEKDLDWQYYFKNLRDVKRFLNAFLQYYPFIKDEVNFKDYFLVVLLRLYFTTVFNELAINREKYLNKSSPSNQASFKLKVKEYKGDIIDFIEKSFPNQQIVKELLEIIFNQGLIREDKKLDRLQKITNRPKTALDKSSSKSILNPSNFLLYFSDHSLVETITNTEFKDLLALKEEELLNCIDFMLQNNSLKLQLEDKFLHYIVSPKDIEFENWYLGYVYLLKNLKEYFFSGVLKQLLTFEEDVPAYSPSAGQLIYYPEFDFSGLNDKKKKEYFERIFKGKYVQPLSDSDFLWQIRADTYYRNKRDSFFMTEEDLLEMNLKILDSEIEKIKSKEKAIDKVLFTLNGRCTVKVNLDKTTVISEKALEKVRSLIKDENLEIFLSKLIEPKSPFPEDHIYEFRPQTFQIFKDNLASEIRKLSDSSPIKRFHKLYQANNYKPISINNDPELKKEILQIMGVKENQ